MEVWWRGEEQQMIHCQVVDIQDIITGQEGGGYSTDIWVGVFSAVIFLPHLRLDPLSYSKQ